MNPCPHCSANLAAPGGCFRTIGIEVRGVYDGVLFWECPDCGGRWHRWPEGHELRARAEQVWARWAALMTAPVEGSGVDRGAP